ncbi:MAG: DUF1501 domain-containing protein [Planctomycetaceae bacterium]
MRTPLINPLAVSRRRALQVSALGAFGTSLRSSAVQAASTGSPKSVLFVFINGGVSQQDSFDLKPDAPADIRGEFQPIDTATPGIQICEHLPLLAQRTNDYALHRAIATDSSGHEEACHMLFTGRLDLPAGFSVENVPNPNEWPSLAAQVTYALRGRGRLPPAAVLPQPSVNEANRYRPGQYAGRIGTRFEAWHLDIASKCPLGNGACPNCFRFDGSAFEHAAQSIFDVPLLALPDGGAARLSGRVGLLAAAEQQQHLAQRAALEELARTADERSQSCPTDRRVRRLDVERADPTIIERYGRNKFGLSLLMASRLLEAESACR